MMGLAMSKTPIQIIRTLREGSHVRRCHTVPHHGEYTVGKHSYDALNILLVLHPAPTIELIKAVAWHDQGERWVGDTPSPALRFFQDLNMAYKAAEEESFRTATGFDILPTLSRADANWLAAVDALELLFWVQEQLAMGNQHVAQYQDRLFERLNSMRENKILPTQVDELLYDLGTMKWFRNEDIIEKEKTDDSSE